MNKIKALYANEIIKIFHRPSVIIVAVITLVISAAFPFLVYMISDPHYEFYDSSVDERAQFEDDLTTAKKELANSGFATSTETVEIETDKGTVSYKMTLYSGNDVTGLLGNQNIYEDLVKNYDFKKNPIRKTWLSMESLIYYRNAERSIISMQTRPFEERDAEWVKEYENLITARDLFRKALFEHDYGILGQGMEVYKDYVDSVNSEIVKEFAATDPNGELGYIETQYLASYLLDKSDKQRSLDAGLEADGGLPRILTEERKEILRNSITILQYKFDKRNTFDEQSFIAVEATYIGGQVARYGLLVLMLLIAGSSVSQEMATGSIKSLIIAPVRRWKIFVGKLLSIITCMLGASVLISLFSIVGAGIAFGFDKLPPYLYVSGGNVAEIPYPVIKIGLDLVQNVTPFFYAMCAFMISCFTKNTGVAVGASAGLYLFHEVPVMLTESDVPIRLLDFTPVANLDLSNKLFPYANLMMTSEDFSFLQAGTYDFKLPLWFSVCYIIVITFTVLFIAFEQFTKKDIQ